MPRTNRSTDRAGYLFVAPAAIFVFAFYGYPMLRTVWLSFHEGSLIASKEYVGADNYARLFRDNGFWDSFLITMIYVVGTTVATLVLAFIIAELLRRVSERWSNLLRALFFIPVIVSTIVATVIFRSVFAPAGGVMNLLPLPFGLDDTNWLFDEQLAMSAIVLFSVWKGVGLYIVLMLASMSGISEAVYEAAAIDGAGPWRTSWSITLPMIKPVMAFAAILNIIYGFQNFALVFGLTRGGPNDATRTLPIFVYDQAFKFFHHGYASAGSVVIIVILGIFSYLILRWSRTGDDG